MDKYEKILFKYWGYDSFRPLQKEIIESLCSGRDTLALLPTGGGKSITYQVSSLAMSGICIVVTPLISLMKDQVDALKKRKIKALMVHSGMTSDKIDATLDNAVYGDYKFLYISPERAKTRIFTERFAKMTVSLIAIDEAHCISQWGYDFRPSYLLLEKLRTFQPSVPVLAVTASATEAVCEDIVEKLKLFKPDVFKHSFARENLSYIMRFTQDKEQHMLKVLYHAMGVSIVYCRLRKECERVAEFLSQNGYSAAAYHGGMSSEARNQVQEDWILEKKRIIVATNAFGMGIDKPNVRAVIHYDMPDSIEAYYQEAGRAGRDGKPAYAVLLHDTSTRRSAEQNITSQFPPIQKIKDIYQDLCMYYSLGIGEGKGERYDFDIKDFCVKFKHYHATVLSAIEILHLNDYIDYSEPSDNPTRIMFVVPRDEMYNIQIHQRHLNEFIQVVMRLYSGVFSFFVKIDESYISKQSGWSLEYINQCFIDIGRLGVLHYIPKRRSAVLFMNEERLDSDNLYISPQTYTLRKQQAEARIKNMIDMIDNSNRCRSIIIREYFGEKNPEPCGKCDVCREHRRVSTNQELVDKLIENDKLDFQQIVSRTKIERETLREILEKGLENGSIQLINGYYFTKK